MSRRLYPSLLLLLLSGIAHSDVLFSTPPDDHVFPTSPPIMWETDASTTQGFATTDSAVTANPTIVSSPAFDISTATKVTTEAPTTSQTSATTDTPTTQQTNVTSAPPTTQQTNVTSAPPTTQQTNVTSAPPTTQQTNASTVVPTNATTAFIPTTPVPTTAPLPNPSIGDYVVRADPGSHVCLKAKMGIQFGIKLGDALHTINIDPNVTSSSGSCGSNGTDSTLTLTSIEIAVQFVFANQTNKFRLSTLNFTLDNGNGSIFSSANHNLSLWEASLGSSYMCRKEQTFNITDSLTLNTFDLQVQPFGVSDDKFSTAHECSVDDTSLLIPIIVGAALAGLIVIVVIAYMIGRRKTHVGYQTL